MINSKLHTHFAFYEEKKSQTLKKQRQPICNDSLINIKKNLHIPEDYANGIQVGDFEQAII